MTLHDLLQCPTLIVSQNISLAPFSSFKIGGAARLLLSPFSKEAFELAIGFVHATSAPYFFLGGGTNVLIGSYPFDGVVILTNRYDKIISDDGFLIVQAGADNSSIAEYAWARGMCGAEFLFGMPGSIGGTVVMNARCYGGEISEIVTEVCAFDSSGKEFIFTNAELGFSYKQSILQKNRYLVHQLRLILPIGNKDKIRNQMDANLKDRLGKDQFVKPNAGCIFKNNYEVGIPTGRLIDELGLKNMSEGGAAILPAHGNFIINRGYATSDQVVSLIYQLQNSLFERVHTKIDCEVQFLGNFGSHIPPDYHNPYPWENAPSDVLPVLKY